MAEVYHYDNLKNLVCNFFSGTLECLLVNVLLRFIMVTHCSLQAVWFHKKGKGKKFTLRRNQTTARKREGAEETLYKMKPESGDTETPMTR